MLKSSRLEINRFESVSFRRKVPPPDAPTVAPADRLPPRLDDGRVADGTVCPTPDLAERHVAEVLHFRDFSPVVREEIQEVAPPPPYSLVPVIVAFQRPEPRLDL